MDQPQHEERRQRIAQIAARVIAREGLDAATFRRIAAEVGCSTTLLTDCFEDKTDLLLAAYRIVATDTLTKFDQRVAADPSNVIDYLVSTSAIDESAWYGWRVHVAFWEKAIRDPLLAAAQRASIALARTSIENAIRACYGPSGDIRMAAQVVIALMHGISIQVLFEQQSWSREQVHWLVAQQLEMVLGRTPLVQKG